MVSSNFCSQSALPKTYTEIQLPKEIQVSAIICIQQTTARGNSHDNEFSSDATTAVHNDSKISKKRNNSWYKETRSNTTISKKRNRYSEVWVLGKNVAVTTRTHPHFRGVDGGGHTKTKIRLVCHLLLFGFAVPEPNSNLYPSTDFHHPDRHTRTY